jgi:transcription antitermination factor NusG
MFRNWYAVYTKPQKERKVVAVLNKKKIENFCPLVSVKEGRGEYKKLSQQPLFDAVVFVHVTEAEIRSLLTISWVATIAYWKSKPAVISDSEIDIVRKVTESYADIKLEKTCVEAGREATIIDGPVMEFSEKTVSVKYKSVKANLPSLGFMITAEGLKQNSRTVYQQQGLFTSFPKRINAFFFN